MITFEIYGLKQANRYFGGYTLKVKWKVLNSIVTKYRNVPLFLLVKKGKNVM